MDNLNIKDDMLFIALDGDGIGKLVGRAVIADDVDKLHKISARIDAAQDFIMHWAKQNDGIKISGGGDEATLSIPKDAEDQVEGLRKDIEHAFGYTISVGIGKSLSEAGTALLVAKLRGKDRIVHFTKEIKEDIKKAKRRVREKRATPDEYKLSEAYLKKGENMENQQHECPYCEQTDGVDLNHCTYCHDAEAVSGEEDCPYCKQSEEATDECPYCVESPEEADSCPYCKDDAPSGQKMPEISEMDNHAAQQDTKIQSPDSNNAQAAPGSAEERADYNEMGMMPPGIPKPQVGDGMAPTGMGQANPMDAGGAPIEPPNADPAEAQGNDSIIPEEGAHSKEALEAIASQIENETIEGKPSDRTEAKNIDDTQIVGDDMEGNVSRPAGYENNTPGDMGLDDVHAQDNGPDLSSVLREGLESQSDEIEKDQVRQMVGQALQGFKASKQILEQSKMQAPQFYQSSIAMLAAMIKMAEMLGLSGNANPQDPMESTPAEETSNEWEEPFPMHPDHGGERKPGHAPSAEEGNGTIGQPIGKLPSKATTHVARTPLPPGAINAKGQQKVIDPKTGKTRFIDRKQGMVQSPTGVPVKPPGRGPDGKPQN